MLAKSAFLKRESNTHSITLFLKDRFYKACLFMSRCYQQGSQISNRPYGMSFLFWRIRKRKCFGFERVPFRCFHIFRAGIQFLTCVFNRRQIEITVPYKLLLSFQTVLIGRLSFLSRLIQDVLFVFHRLLFSKGVFQKAFFLTCQFYRRVCFSFPPNVQKFQIIIPLVFSISTKRHHSISGLWILCGRLKITPRQFPSSLFRKGEFKLFG